MTAVRLTIGMRKKLIRFTENLAQDNIIEPKERGTNPIKGKWGQLYFNNSNPIVLELGCGRGEYTIGLARKYPNKNFIGIDIKGDRIWFGSQSAKELQLSNVAFLRDQIENLNDFFESDEVSEIWITFPGPRPKESHAKKRLTSPRFLELYKQILNKEGVVNFKTDSEALFEYTLEVLSERSDIVGLESIKDLYNEPNFDEAKSIQTHFEERFIKEGKTIKYIRFSFI